jgi:alanyl-tRNA synthetase
MMLFGEKYGDVVRVLDIGSSRELCGGTHVDRTGDIGYFRVVSEGGVAAGIRRVEAVAGAVALAQAQADRDRLARAADALKAQPQEIDAKIAQVIENVKALEREVARLKGEVTLFKLDDLLGAGMRTIKDVKLVVLVLDGADAGMLRDSLDKVKERMGSGVALLASVADGKVSLIAGVTKDLTGKVKAGELVNFVAQQVGGKGGGRPDMAQAGGTRPEGLKDALLSVEAWLGQRL